MPCLYMQAAAAMAPRLLTRIHADEVLGSEHYGGQLIALE